VSGPEVGLALSVLAACAVEAVEALTIVLAVGATRSWRSALTGVGAAILVLAVVTAALGPAVTALPLGVLRVVVGGLLLVFGLQWLRKAILRAAGLKALHDELAAFEAEQAAARGARGGGSAGGGAGLGGGGRLGGDAGLGGGGRLGGDAGLGGGGRLGGGLDAYSFTVAFKGVLLEGLEVVFIVLTFGANQHDVGLAAAAAAVAVLAVAAAGVVAHAPLARVPENTLKFGVGVMLTSFGTFWGAEGAGAHWPGGDVALLAIIPATLACSLAMVSALRRGLDSGALRA
jgi:uncharacterized membrane protein